jgi:hypothetical protein
MESDNFEYKAIHRNLIRKRRIAFIFAVMTVLIFSPLIEAKEFRIFDATNFSNKPDLEEYGIERLHVIYAGALWDRYKSRNDIDEIKIREAIQYITETLSVEMAVVDIEHWPVFNVDQNTVNESIEKYERVIQIMKSENPELTLGYYSVFPIREYWIPVLAKPEKMDYWQSSNQRLMQISDHVDYIFPSLYTFYSNQEGWVRYAEENLKEARQYGKPVYAFLWPYYHESNKLYGGKKLSEEYWAKQLEVVYKNADGVVIWDASRDSWEEESGWWAATKDFMNMISVNKKAIIANKKCVRC